MSFSDAKEGADRSRQLHEGLARQAGGDLVGAEMAYHAVLAERPEDADALHLLGMVAHARGDADAAVTLISRAIAARPGEAQFHNSLGTVLGAGGRHADAAGAFGRAVALDGRYAEARRNLGVALRRLGRHDVAVDAERRALDLAGGPRAAYRSLGLRLRELRRLDEAVDVFRAAAALAPGSDPGAHFDLALALLEAGRYAEGFREYEWRWRLGGFEPRRPTFPVPPWDGSDLGGRTVLLYAEQGLGTAVQFARFAPLVATRRAGRAVVRCPAPLVPLLATLRGVAGVVADGRPVPACDAHAPLASLPRLLGVPTSPANVPADVPYLAADPARAAAWAGRIAEACAAGGATPGRGLRVGLVWAGNPKPNPDRTCPVDALAPLRSVPGVRFFSLQKGPAAGELGRLASAGLAVTDLADELHDFGETAAALANLDLVISVDTSVTHVAGALGRPVWTLLPYLADWRWGAAERTDSPWYPTMRLFRQPRPGDWPAVLARVAGALGELVSRRA